MANKTAGTTSKTTAIAHMTNLTFDLTGKKVSKKEFIVLEDANTISDIPGIVKTAYADALRDSHDGRVERTNVCGRMGQAIKRQLMGKIKGKSRFNLSTHILNVAFQCYQMDFDSATPSCGEITTYRGDGNKVIYLRPKNFFPASWVTKHEANRDKAPIHPKCRATSYRNSHSMGKAYNVFARNLVGQSFVMYKEDIAEYLAMFKKTAEYDNSREGKDYNGKESLEMKLKRAKAALEYLHEHVMGQAIVFSPVPDSRSRVAKYRYYFLDGRELNTEHTWFINFFSESWRSNMFETYDTMPLCKKGLDALKVSGARFHWKSKTSQRLSWRKARSYFAKHKESILSFMDKDRDHGFYYPRMAGLIVDGVGTETGFLLEADLSASGIGSAAMNIHSKGTANVTALTGKATPSDAHRTIVERVLSLMLYGKQSLIDMLIHSNYKAFKKFNVEITHAQTPKTTAAKWNSRIAEIASIKFKWNVSPYQSSLAPLFIPIFSFAELTEDDLRAIYDDVMPGLLEWIETVTSITPVGVNRDIPVLFFRAIDGVKCATSAYTKGREFSAHAVTKDAKSRRLALKMDMPIEIDSRGICYEGVNTAGERVIYINKMMGAWANLIQADDAWMLRAISLLLFEKFGIVPLVKHDGYYIHPNLVGVMIGFTYEVRKEQFIKRPLLKSFNQIASFLDMNVEGDLRDHGMTLADFRCAVPEESPLMMT